MGTLLCNLALALACVPAWLTFQAGARQGKGVQRRFLRRLLRRNQDTLFGRQHGFAHIRTVEEYRRAVPVRGYEDIAPYVERIRNGEQAVLTAQKVRLLEPTSGSRGPVKLIPYTDGLRASFQRGLKVWQLDLFRRYPRMLRYKAYWSLTPRAALALDSAVPVGFDEDEAYLGRLTQWLYRQVMLKPLPGAPFPEGTRELLRRQARQLGFVSLWSPSLLESIFAGEVIPFPHLQLLSCWADAQAGRYVHLAQKYLPGVDVQPKGLLSTECMTSFPLTGLDNRAVLALSSAFFEFMDGDGTCFEAHELEQGGLYRLIVSTEGGLYRYDTADMVEITGFFHTVPTLRFMGRAGGVRDFCGEKLHEHELEAALQAVCEALDVAPGFAMFGFSNHGYELYLEAACAFEDRALAALAETRLAQNFHYANCLQTGQLQPLVLRQVVGGLATWHAWQQARGIRPGDIKPPLFDEHLCRIFPA